MILPCSALAGGFEIQQSTYFQGMSFAGVAAGGPSISSMSWNPATSAFASNGLTIEASLAGVFTEANLTVLNPGSQPPGAAAVDMGRNSLLGASFSTWRVNEKTVLGLSITSPFGLLTKPDDPDWSGRFVALTTKIFSLNATPSLSYELVPGLAIGGGVQLQYFDLVRLTAATPIITRLGLSEVISDINADDFGVGFTAGINFSPGPRTSIGLGFRSSVQHKLKGDTTVGSLASAPIRSDIELPEKVTFSFRQAIHPSARLLGTVDWTNWSRFGVIPIVLQGSLPNLSAGETIANLDFRWRDGWLFALGGEYDWSPILTLRAGAAYEISPVDSATTRLVQVPDSNRTWLSVGATYKLSADSALDLAYSHAFFENDAPFDRLPSSVLLQQVPPLLGESNLSADMISVSWKMRWGG